MSKAMLFECAAGVALFAVDGVDAIAGDKASSAVQDYGTLSQMLSLRAFMPFTSAEMALEAINAVSEGAWPPVAFSSAPTLTRHPSYRRAPCRPSPAPHRHPPRLIPRIFLRSTRSSRYLPRPGSIRYTTPCCIAQACSTTRFAISSRRSSPTRAASSSAWPSPRWGPLLRAFSAPRVRLFAGVFVIGPVGHTAAAPARQAI